MNQLTEEQEKILFLLESDVEWEQDLALQLITNGEKENLQVFLHFITNWSFWSIEPFFDKILQFEHCKNILHCDTCIKIANELNRSYRYIKRWEGRKKTNSIIHFFRHIAPKKNLSFYLSKK